MNLLQKRGEFWRDSRIQLFANYNSALGQVTCYVNQQTIVLDRARTLFKLF